MSIASARSVASMIAKPASGNEDTMNGPFVVSTRAALGLRTCASTAFGIIQALAAGNYWISPERFDIDAQRSNAQAIWRA